MRIIGIYKITSPTNRIYIGQSININSRFNRYKKMHYANKTQTRLWRSLSKYGPDKHIFEIIEECEISDLNVRERYWQDEYNVIGKLGLNCILQETNTAPRIYTEEYYNKVSKQNHWNYGKKVSQKTRAKMSQSAMGRKASKSTKQKLSKLNKGISNNFYGKKHSNKSKLKMSQSAKLRTVDPINEQLRKDKISKKLSKPVLKCDLNNNVLQEYSSVTEAAKDIGSHVGSICHTIKGVKVKTHKGFKWKYKL